MTVCSGTLNSSILVQGEFRAHLWGYNSWSSLICNSDRAARPLRPIVRLKCQTNDSVAFIDGNGRNVEFIKNNNEDNSRTEAIVESNASREEEVEAPSLEELRESLEKALKELEVAHLNSTMFEEKAQRISEAAIALKDEAANAWNDVNSTLDAIQVIVNEESLAKEAVQKATMTLSLAEARLQVAMDSLEAAKGSNFSPEGSKESDSEYDNGGEESNLSREQDEALLVAHGDIRMDALKVEEDVANIMLLAEQAVAFELEATQHVNDAEIALQRAEKNLTTSHVDSLEATIHQNGSSSQGQVLSEEVLVEEEKAIQRSSEFTRKQFPKLIVGSVLFGAGMAFYANRAEMTSQLFQQPDIITTSIDEVSSNAKPLVRQIRKLPKRIKKLIEKLPHQEMNEEEASLFDMLWLLLASVIFVPIFQKIPGGSPVLGYLAAGILIGPYGLSIIRHVHGTKAIAEFGVVFLLFNIGLELSVERLSSMKKYVFGLGSAQVLVTAVVVGLVTHFVAGQPGPAAIVIGNGLALSSTAVVLQVLQERGESTVTPWTCNIFCLTFPGFGRLWFC
ncbi:hypothetical protein F0562_019197 [Nyssa sinensis]|uniref:Cation/H+ exchanger transmembrane domain-containing protein n=1 Tax=Nyssa sinensis TaxID=561372 RepID=A0A5J4ZES6_9ASTE|nr:hypothetical protein F0562_019197 [Nyssa sinensis]